MITMSHDLATKSNGQAALWLNGEPAWHRLGTVWDTATQGKATVAQILEASGQDFTLELWPTFYGNDIESKMGTNLVTEGKRWAVIRTDTQQQLGTVGNGYTIFQPSQAYGFLDEIAAGGAEFESAGLLAHGARTFVTMKLGEDIVLDGQGAADRIRRFLFATQFNNGRGSLVVGLTGTRMVCSNTLNWGLENAESRFLIQHRAGGLDKVAEAAVALKLSDHYFEQFTKDATAMIHTKMTVGQFTKFASTVAFPEVKDASKTVTERRDAKIAHVVSLFKDAKTQENIRGTRWAGINALTEAIDHPPVEGAAPKSLLLDNAIPKTLQAQMAKGARVVEGSDVQVKTTLHRAMLTWKNR